MNIETMANILVTLLALVAAWSAAYWYLRYTWFRSGVPLRNRVVDLCSEVLRDRSAPERAKIAATFLASLVSAPGTLRRFSSIVRRGTRSKERSSSHDLNIPSEYSHKIKEAIQLTATACLLEDWHYGRSIARSLRRSQQAPRDIRRREARVVQCIVVKQVNQIREGEFGRRDLACA